MIQRIVIPVDFDQASKSAVEIGARIAASFGAAVALVHVCVPPFGVGTEAAVMRPDISGDQLTRGRELIAQQHVAFTPSTAVEDFVVDGQPADQIVAIARRWQADLVIVSTHQRHGLARLILGSVAEVVIRYAPCTVLVVRPTETAPPPP